MLVKTRGIVLNFIKYRESSIIALIYTEQLGLQTYIVNSVRKKGPGSRIALFQPFTLLDMVVYTSPKGGITRISEYKYLTGQTHPLTSITYEYPSAEGDPYYPIPHAENQALFKKYEALADKMSNVTFVGRLATYRYYNMDQVAGQALAAFRRIEAKRAGEKLTLGKPHTWFEAAE